MSLCFRVMNSASLFVIVLSSQLSAAEPAKLAISQPQPFQVVQREGFDPKRSSVNEPGGPELGFADLVVRAPRPKDVTGAWQFRLELLAHGFGSSYDWSPFDVGENENELRGLVEVPAGGWYRLHVRCLDGETTTAAGSVEPIGVGEVFLVAGQSYAGGHNDEVMKVTDPSQAVSTYDWQAKTWRIANDPPPHNGDGGSIWPPLGDMLAPTLRVPVAFVNVSVGATSTTKWMPDGELHKRLCTVGKEIGLFRAVLWQQGESDVIEKTPIDTYIKNLREIREAAGDAWQFEPTWVLAKSTLHPTVYHDPIGEHRIRTAIDQLGKQPGFRPGPDTDVLGGDNRGDAKSRRHFSAAGQRRAALLWFAVLWTELHAPGNEQSQ
jgi:Carbohydrate esterase, sialic acid-specific acetylesterase